MEQAYHHLIRYPKNVPFEEQVNQFLGGLLALDWKQGFNSDQFPYKVSNTA